MAKIGCKRTIPKKPLKRKLPKSKPTRISDWVLDDLVRKILRFSSGGFCKRCKKFADTSIEVAHMYRRKRKTVRWDLRNVYPLCPSCHQEIDNDPVKLSSFLYEVMTREQVAELQELANLTIKQHPIDREQIRDSLRERIKIMEDK